jgi:hypothetical protein
VFKNRVQSKVFGPKRGSVKICLKKLHNKKPHELWYLHQILLQLKKSRRMRWNGNVAYMRQNRNAYRVWWRKGDNMESQGIHGRIILKWILTEMGSCTLFCLADDSDRWQGLVNTEMNL